MNFYFTGNGQRKNSLLTRHHFLLLRLKQESCISRRLWCHVSNFLERGKTIDCLQVHEMLWNHSTIEEKKILPYSGNLPKSLPAGAGRSSSSVVNLKKRYFI